MAPRLLPAVHAQDDDGEDEGGSTGPKLTDEQKKELQAIGKSEQRAAEAIQSQDYEAGAKAFKKLCEKVDKSTLPEEILGQVKVNAHYNLSCCLSRIKSNDEAVAEFVKSVELGFFDWKHISEDEDLNNVRDLDSFKKAVDDGKKLEIDRLASQVKGDKAPFKLSFEATGTDDKTIKLDAYKGKVLVLLVLIRNPDGSVNEESIHTVSALNKANENLKGKGVEFLALVGAPDADSLKSIGSDAKVKFTLGRFESRESAAGMNEALTKGGFFIVVDPSGKPRAYARGAYQSEAVEAAVKPLLGDVKDEPKKDEPKKDEPKKDDKKDKRDDF
jgi:hypothetical protein